MNQKYHGKVFPRTLMHSAANRWLNAHHAELVGWAHGRGVFLIDGGLYWGDEGYTTTHLRAILPIEVSEWRKTKAAALGQEPGEEARQ